MSRLTIKVPNYNHYRTLDTKFIECEGIDKLGKLEDIFELIEEMYKKPVCWKSADDVLHYYDYTHSTILYNPKTNEIEIYEYDFQGSYKIEEYGVTWWIKEDKTE